MPLRRYAMPIAMWWGWFRYSLTDLPKQKRTLQRPNAGPSASAITMQYLRSRRSIIISLIVISNCWMRGALIRRTGRQQVSKERPVEPMTIIKNQISIDKPIADVYAFLADCNNHEQLMPDSIYDWSSTRDEARFTIQN